GAVSATASIAGAVVTNTLTSVTSAVVQGGSQVTAPGKISVTSTDTQKISADVTAASVGLTGSGGAAISFALAVTSAENVVAGQNSAIIDGSIVTSNFNAVEVKALSQSDIDVTGLSAAITVAGSAGGSVAGSGTVSLVYNTLTNQVTAAIRNGSTVSAQTGIVV